MKRTGSSIFAKRFLALLMVVVMLAAQLPTMAWADEGAPVDPPAEGEPAPQAETAGTDAGGTDTATVTPTPAPETTPEAKDEGTTPVPETTPEAKDEGAKATPVPETTPEAKDEGTKATPVPETTPEAKDDDAKAPATGDDETTTYTVTLDFNGETPASQAGLTAVEGKYTFTYTADNTSLPTLDAKQEWYLWENDTFTGSIVKTVGTADTGKTYKLRHTYTVTFALGYEGAPAADTKDVLEGKPVEQPKDPTREGDYRFDRWMNGTDAYVFTTPVGSDIALTAAWVETYTVTYTSEHGVAPVSTTADKDHEMALPQMENVASHTFKGWKINGTTYTDKYTGNASVTAEAQWEIKKYTVNFYGDITASDASATVTNVEHGSTVAEYPSDGTPVTAPEGANEELVRWDAYADGKYTEFKLGETQVTADTALYARWSYNITYVNYVNNEDATVEEGKTLPATYVAGEETTIPILTKEGYTFTGWKNGTGEEAVTVEKIDANTIGKVTLYATWQLNSNNYTITAGSDTLTVTDGNTEWTKAETVTIEPKAPATGVIVGEAESVESYSVKAEGETSVSFKLTDGTNTPSETVDVNVRIDRTVPAVDFAYESTGGSIKDNDGVQMSNAGVIITVTPTDSASGMPEGWQNDAVVVLYQNVDGGGVKKIDLSAEKIKRTPTCIKVTLSAADLGENKTYYLSVSSIKDAVGNGYAGTSASFGYDGTKPTVLVKNEAPAADADLKYYPAGDKTFYNGVYTVSVSVAVSETLKKEGVPLGESGENTKIVPDGVVVTGDGSKFKTSNYACTPALSSWSGVYTVTGEGPHTVTATATDSLTRSATHAATAYIDMTAPVVSTAPTAMTAAAQSYTPMLVFTDGDGSGVKAITYTITADAGYNLDKVTVGGETYSSKAAYTYNSESKPVISVSEGVFKGTISFIAEDNVGNKSEAATAALYIDKSAPVVNVELTSKEEVTNKDVTVTLTVTDDNINLLAAPGEKGENTADIAVTMDKKAFDDYTATGWSFDEGQGAWTNTLTIAPDAEEHSKDGVYTVTLGATDSCGNITEDENKKSVSFTIDTIDAETKIAFAENGAPTDGTANPTKEATYYSHNDVIYTLTVSDANLKLTEDGQPDVTITGLADGTYELTAWTETATAWTATLTIPANAGEYSFTLDADDKAGNGSNTSDSGTLVIDTTDPVIEIDPPAVASKWISGYAGDEKYYLTGGETDTITIHVKDENLVPEETGKLGAAVVSVFKKGESTPVTGDNIVVSPWESEGDNSWKCVVTFKDSAEDGEYHITVQAADATRPADAQLSEGSGYSKETSKDYVVDNTAPEVSFVSYQGNEDDSKHYANVKGETTNTKSVYAEYVKGADKLAVTIQIEDVNIDLENPAVETNKADVVVKRGEDTLTIDKDYTESSWKYNETSKCWENTVTITSEEEGVYTVSVTATDKASNKNADAPKVSDSLINDTTAPAVEANIPASKKQTTYSGKNVYYFDAEKAEKDGAINLVWTFAVSDAYLNTVTAKVSTNGEAFSDSSLVSVEDGTVTATFKADGTYQVQIVATDYAGNQTTYTSDYIVIDTTVPTAKIEAKGDAESFKDEEWQTVDTTLKTIWYWLVDTLGFENRYAKDNITVTLTWGDNSTEFKPVGGGVTAEYFVYEYSEKNTSAPASKEDVGAITGWTKADGVSDKTISFPAVEKFVVYMKVTDEIGNVTYLSSNGMIVDNVKPDTAVSGSDANKKADNSAPTITVVSAGGVHQGSTTLGVNITELPDYIFSGIGSVTYSLGNDDGKVSVTDPGKMTYSNEIDGLNGYGEQSVTLSISDVYEINDIAFTVNATDNSGNSSSVTVNDINIDNRTPTAVIRYDNNEVYNNKYFNQPRVATITVTELNFDENNTRVNTTGSRSGWTRSNETHSTATNTATVSYTTDGDYTLDFQTTDKAGHTLYDSGVTYDGAAPQEFTIDMTKPRATITFRDADGNEVPSGGYANSTVTATITIVEHNFDANSATNGIRITRDGETYRANVSWSTSGDTHTATIPFIEEEGALYTFDMSFVDLANNECDPFQRVSFYVDTMLPSITVSEIANNSANNAATIAPVVTVTDKYYDPNGVTVTLTGAKNGVVASAYSVSDVENGQQFTFENIEKDDIYTLTVKATDLAGNVNEEMYVEETGDTTDRVTFSVNREGSTYGVDEDTQALLKQYYTNKLDKDLKLTIINVDEIDPADLIVTVSLGLLDSRDLVEGEDYSIDMQPITGGYMYTVTIFKEVFDKDGAYTISVFTKDKAGNTSTNVTADDEHGMEMAFYLDTQAPTIVLNDLGKGKTYSVERYEDGSVSVSDQTLDEITVVLTYRTGEVATYVWDSEEIYSADFNGTYLALLSGSRAIEQSKRSINIRVTAKDKAGNVAEGPYTETDGGIVVDEEYNFYVTTNPLTRFYANKGLFFGSIGGLVVLAAVVTGLVLSKKKKKATV